MPNRTIYLNTINAFHQDVGLAVFNPEELRIKLLDAWENDKTEGKSNFLDSYRAIFRTAFKAFMETEIFQVFHSLSGKMPSAQKCLLSTDEKLKICAMALIPELRTNTDVLSNMTFGVMEESTLTLEIDQLRRKCLSFKSADKAVKKSKAESYEKYKAAWEKAPKRNLSEIIKNEVTLRSMSKKEQMDYALALSAYLSDGTHKTPLNDTEKLAIQNAVVACKKVLGCEEKGNLEEFLGSEYFQYGQKIGNGDWLSREVKGAIGEYNKAPDPSKQEIANFAELVKTTAKTKKEKETAEHYTEITDEGAAEIAGFFAQEELAQELADTTTLKERALFTDNVAEVNKKYSLRISAEKLRTSIEQVSVMMVKARDEKERFLSKDGVVVIENGEETYYTAEEYFKDYIDQTNKEFLKKVEELEMERTRVKTEHEKSIANITKHEDSLAGTVDLVIESKERSFKIKDEEITAEVVRLQRALTEALSAAKGGIVIEKDGDTSKRYKASEYYETHETQKEQAAYREYQKMFATIYQDACKATREKDYLKGVRSDFASVAKDVDGLFKAAMYVAGVYDDPKNKEVVQKCNFGGFSTEQLSESVVKITGDSWSENQSSEQAWTLQKTEAKRIVSEWVEAEKTNPKARSGELIQETLENSRKAFKKGQMTKKQLFDYMIAAEAHLQKRNAIFSITSGGVAAMNELNLCRLVTGLKRNDSLRAAINLEYTKMANSLYKENIFKSIQDSVSTSPTFEEEKGGLDQKHQALRDKIMAQKQAELDRLRAEGREPFPLPHLDERKTILNQTPRSQPVQPPSQLQTIKQKEQ